MFFFYWEASKNKHTLMDPDSFTFCLTISFLVSTLSIWLKCQTINLCWTLFRICFCFYQYQDLKQPIFLMTFSSNILSSWEPEGCWTKVEALLAQRRWLIFSKCCDFKWEKGRETTYRKLTSLKVISNHQLRARMM